MLNFTEPEGFIDSADNPPLPDGVLLHCTYTVTVYTGYGVELQVRTCTRCITLRGGGGVEEGCRCLGGVQMWRGMQVKLILLDPSRMQLPSLPMGSLLILWIGWGGLSLSSCRCADLQDSKWSFGSTLPPSGRWWNSSSSVVTDPLFDMAFF